MAEKEVTRPTDEAILERVALANIVLSPEAKVAYTAMPDSIGPFKEGMLIPDGFKKCGRCQEVMKFFMYNKNSGSKTQTTGNCKACQKASAAQSYIKTKSSRDYKKYYDENKERKQAHSRKYYATHKEELAAKHQAYHSSTEGRKAMNRAHSKRRNLMAANTGIPHTRELVIERDKMGKEFPVCYYCGKTIKDMTGKGLHMDHVIPVAIEGADCFTNVACMHSHCNMVKKKDASDITAIMIHTVRKRAEDYIDANPEKFGLDQKE